VEWSFLTLNPSLRKHDLCASIRSAQASSPFCVMHSSRTFFVSGQAQHIFFFCGWVCTCSGALPSPPFVSVMLFAFFVATEILVQLCAEVPESAAPNQILMGFYQNTASHVCSALPYWSQYWTLCLQIGKSKKNSIIGVKIRVFWAIHKLFSAKSHVFQGSFGAVNSCMHVGVCSHFSRAPSPCWS
jgi:hypothetical protein